MPKLMFQPKWFETSRDIKVEDIVSFLKHDSLLSKMYQYGMITNIEYGKDGIVRRVDVKYWNANENVNRSTKQSARDIVDTSRRWNQHNGRTRYDDTLIAANANSKFQENVSNKQTFLNHVGECCLKIGECCQKFCLCICTICLESSLFLLTVTKYFITFEFCGNYNMYLMLNFP